MKLFKKISAIAASALMIGMTAGVAAAANYPIPFIVGSTTDVAIVYGTGAGVSSLDVVQGGNIQANLQSKLSSPGTTTSTSVSGEAVELFTGGTKLYFADNLNKVKKILAKTDLPSVLADGEFFGNVDATYTQTIQVGSNPSLTFAKQPTSSDDPNFALALSTQSTNAIYNLSVMFSTAVNFSHPDSTGETIELFGKEFTVAAATTAADLVLLKSAEKLFLTSDNPVADVTIAGAGYTIELVSASDTSATVKVVDKATGTSDQRSVNVASSRRINGVNVAVQTADSNAFQLSASLIVGSEKVTFTDGSEVKIGDSNTPIDGTRVSFHGGNPSLGLSRMTVSVAANNADEDAVKVGESFADPVFGTVKLVFSGLNVDVDSTLREDIKFAPSGDDKMEVTFADQFGVSKTINYEKYGAGGTNVSLFIDSEGRNMTVVEGKQFRRGDYVIVGNEDNARMIKLTSVSNTSGGIQYDRVEFQDVFSGATYTTTISAEGVGTVQIGTQNFDVAYVGASGISSDEYLVSLGYPDSTGTNKVFYPTMLTEKGAKVAFYVPSQFNVSTSNGIMVPNGAGATGYQTMAVVANSSVGGVNVTCSGNVYTLGAGTDAVKCDIASTGFSYNISYVTDATLNVKLLNAAGISEVNRPAVMIFYDKDNNNAYQGLIVTSENTGKVGVGSVERTYDNIGTTIALVSDNKIEKAMDLWGTIITVDKGDSDQHIATVSYPKEQVHALLYMAEESAEIDTEGGSSGGSGVQLGEILVRDTEVNSVRTKNLIVVGGSCINSVAANLVGGALCGSRWTDATGVGSGQFLIQSFGGAYTSGKIALLVAGYEAADTVNAAKYLTTKDVDTSVGMKYKGTSATSAELVTTTA